MHSRSWHTDSECLPSHVEFKILPLPFKPGTDKMESTRAGYFTNPVSSACKQIWEPCTDQTPCQNYQTPRIVFCVSRLVSETDTFLPESWTQVQNKIVSYPYSCSCSKVRPTFCCTKGEKTNATILWHTREPDSLCPTLCSPRNLLWNVILSFSWDETLLGRIFTKQGKQEHDVPVEKKTRSGLCAEYTLPKWTYTAEPSVYENISK